MRPRELRLTGLLLVILLSSACSLIGSTDAPAILTAPAALASLPAPTSAIALPDAPTDTAAPRPALAPARAARTAVVVSDDIPAYQEIVTEIRRRGMPEITVHHLTEYPDDADRVIAEISGTHPDRLIAIGLPAANLARQIPGTPMVFCQVYNYQDYDLLSTRSKGVDMLPPFALQLAAWQRLARNLHRIGVVTGPGHDALIGEMREAVERSGIVLTARTVHSDREALFVFKELAPDVDGFWLLPDNRILSPEVVREIMAYSTEHAKQLVVSTDALLDLGALLSVSSDPRDVVDRLFARLADVDESGRLPGPDMLDLRRMRVEINTEAATRLGLLVPNEVANSR